MILPADRLDFPEGKDVVVLARCQARGGDADKARRGAADVDQNVRTARIRRVGPGGVAHQAHVVAEGRVVGDFNLVPRREAETGADVVVAVEGRDQPQLLDPLRLAQIDLHPFDRVLRRGDGAVPAVLRAQR